MHWTGVRDNLERKAHCYVPDDVVRAALEADGNVEDITRDTFKVYGFVRVESTTRFVRLLVENALPLPSFRTNCGFR